MISDPNYCRFKPEGMKTPREKYYGDPSFHTLVDTMVRAIMDSKFTPSEMRDAALLASIKYEEITIRSLTTWHGRAVKVEAEIAKKKEQIAELEEKINNWIELYG